MPALTIKNLPDELYRRLKESASRHRRSLNQELIVCLEAGLGSGGELDVKAFLEEVRALRSRVSGPPFTARELDAAKRSGRR